MTSPLDAHGLLTVAALLCEDPGPDGRWMRAWGAAGPLGGSGEVVAGRGRRAELQVGPLNRLVLEMRQDAGIGPDGVTIPWFDPDGGGVHGRLLFLLQDPSQVAA